MGHSWAAEIVRFCIRWRWRVIALAAVATLVSTLYAVTQFAINTNTEGLLGRDLPWEQHHFAYQAAFPEHQIVAIVEAPTPELAEIAASRLTAALRRRSDVIRSVQEPQGGAFAERSALLYLPPDRLSPVVGGLRGAAPAFGLLAADPSLRGAMQALTSGAGAVQAGHLPAEGLGRPADALSDMLEAMFAGRFASFSWRALMEADETGVRPAGPARQLRALARSWAAEVVAHGVTVNVVSPAATGTAMLSDPSREGETPIVPPLGRLIQPAEIASLVVFLVSPAAAAGWKATTPLSTRADWGAARTA
jgi:hypothetical protein